MRNTLWFDVQALVAYERAVMHAGGAALSDPVTLTDTARGQVTQHTASDNERSSLALVTRTDVEGRETRVDGGASAERRLVRRLDKAIERDDRVAIATIETQLGYGYGDRFIREGGEASFMRMVSGDAPHTCDLYTLPDGECEVCWLASK